MFIGDKDKIKTKKKHFHFKFIFDLQCSGCFFFNFVQSTWLLAFSEVMERYKLEHFEVVSLSMYRIQLDESLHYLL